MLISAFKVLKEPSISVQKNTLSEGYSIYFNMPSFHLTLNKEELTELYIKINYILNHAEDKEIDGEVS